MLLQVRFPWVWLPQHSGMGGHGGMKVVASVPGDTDPHPHGLPVPALAPNPPAGPAGLQPQEEPSLPPNSGQEGDCREPPPGPGRERGGTKIRRLFLPSLSSQPP